MKKLTQEEIRAKQIQMLDYIDELCTRKNLTYYLAYGTLIGAIRHKGYIPWDDDIDLWILREDYDAFKEAIQAEKKYDFVDTESNPNFRLDFAKVVDTSVLINETGAKEKSTGLFIDIFPLDAFGDTQEEVKRNLKRISKRRKKFYFCNFSLKALDGSLVKRFIKFHIVVWHKFLLSFCSIPKVIKKYHKLLSETNKKYTKYIGYFDSPYQNPDKYVYEKEDFVVAKGWFEGKEYNIPKNYDAILTKFYGEYMTLPPVEEQKNHGLEAYSKEDLSE
ncbi:MAG: LicD family protein [Anaeroplasmataceae bacterium]|nr:LicD family protein [Anaeroplasmataceae bacterium]